MASHALNPKVFFFPVIMMSFALEKSSKDFTKWPSQLLDNLSDCLIFAPLKICRCVCIPSTETHEIDLHGRSTAPASQRSWVQISFKPPEIFFTGSHMRQPLRWSSKLEDHFLKFISQPHWINISFKIPRPKKFLELELGLPVKQSYSVA